MSTKRRQRARDLANGAQSIADRLETIYDERAPDSHFMQLVQAVGSLAEATRELADECESLEATCNDRAKP